MMKESLYIQIKGSTEIRYFLDFELALCFLNKFLASCLIFLKSPFVLFSSTELFVVVVVLSFIRTHVSTSRVAHSNQIMC